MQNIQEMMGSMIGLVIWIGLYVTQAIALMTIANKTSTENSWMAWIPILNMLLLLNIAGLDWWYLLLMCVPCVGILVFIYAWWRVCEERGKPGALGILMIVPVVNWFLPLYVAFSD